MERWRKDNRLPVSTVRDELATIAETLEVNPLIGDAVVDAQRPGRRRLYLWRIGYHLFYRVDERKAQVVIIGIRHERRRPVRM